MINSIYRFMNMQTTASRITIWVFLFICISGIFHSLSYMYLDRSDRIKETLTNMEYALNSQKTIMNNWAHERTKDVRYLANLQEAKEMNPQSMRVSYEYFLKYDEEFETIITLDSDGYIVTDSLQDDTFTENINIKAQDYFTAAKEGKEYIYDITSSNMTKKPMVIFSTPILSTQDEFQGVLFSSTNLIKIKELLSESIYGKTGKITLINNDKDVIFQLYNGGEVEVESSMVEKLDTSMVKHIFSDESIAETYTNKYGTQVIGSYTDLFEGRYFLISEINKDEILSSHYRMTTIQISITLIIIVLTITFIMPIISHLLRPMIYLTRALTKMKEGNYNAQLDPQLFETSPIELRKSIKVFNEMSEEISENKETLQRLSSTDELTGVANRRMFDTYFDEMWRQAKEEQTPLSIAFLDIDFFKKFNDHFGHQRGDECIQKVAHTISHSLKKSGGFVARYGGEEFIIIFPETNSHGATGVAKRICREVRELRIKSPGNDVAPYVTVSIGVTSLVPVEGIEKELLISQSDQALYQAKLSGRNKVITHTLPLC